MRIEDIIKTYGNNDYYELSTGRLFKLSQMEYNLFKNITKVPVLEPNGILNFIELQGNYVYCKCKKSEYDSKINKELGILGEA